MGKAIGKKVKNVDCDGKKVTIINCDGDVNIGVDAEFSDALNQDSIDNLCKTTVKEITKSIK